MSRLAEAETRFADAIKALEAAVESRLAVSSDVSSGAAVERAQTPHARREGVLVQRPVSALPQL